MKRTNNYKLNSLEISRIIKEGGVGIIPTDTIYGLVGSAFSKKAVDRIFKLKKRDLHKPLIVLISSFDDLKLFGIKEDKKSLAIIRKNWPGKISIILPVNKKNLDHIHRGTRSIAFRLPKKRSLIRLLQKTGPLVAPSANPEFFPAAKNITAAKKYFGGQVDFYVPAGIAKASSSTLITIKNGNIKILRQGEEKAKIQKPPVKREEFFYPSHQQIS